MVKIEYSTLMHDAKTHQQASPQLACWLSHPRLRNSRSREETPQHPLCDRRHTGLRIDVSVRGHEGSGGGHPLCVGNRHAGWRVAVRDGPLWCLMEVDEVNDARVRVATDALTKGLEAFVEAILLLIGGVS